MSALLGSLAGAEGAGGLTGLAAGSVMGDLKNDASGVSGQNPLAQLLAPTPQVQAQAQAPVFNFPQMPDVDPNRNFVGVGTIPISQYFVGGKSG